MNETIQQLFDRKSVRRFEPVEIPAEAKALIIQSALQAPTAGNQILYSIIDVTDKTIKDSLAVSCDNQPFIATAPMVLIFVADCRRWLDAYTFAGAEPRKPLAGDIMLACADAAIAAQNSVVAAQSLGIGSCYIGDILEYRQQHMQMLGLDEYTLPACMVVYGYPHESQENRVKPVRFDAEYIVTENTYRRRDEAETRKAFAVRSGKPDFDYDDHIKKFCKRKYMSDFSLEMSRSVAEYLQVFSDDEEC